MFTKRFWLSLAERAGKTFAQSLGALLTADGVGLLDIDWPAALSAAGMAAFLSVLTSIASERIGPDQSPSLVGEPPKQPEALLEDEAPGAHALDGVGRGDEPERPANLFERP
jgi:hypothetical protein